VRWLSQLQERVALEKQGIDQSRVPFEGLKRKLHSATPIAC
jgi:hypothetical protein